jgi:hypothetical protein
MNHYLIALSLWAFITVCAGLFVRGACVNKLEGE